MKSINPDRILFEDEHILAVNKLHRELTVKGKGEVGKLPLLDFLKQSYGNSLRPLHRLDFETSGVLLFAKTKQCFDEAVTKKKFVSEESGVKKFYRAIVMGRMKKQSGVINQELPARQGKVTLPAETKYTVLQRFGDTSYVEAQISAGKHHQIRKHFASIDHPLVNDDRYGNEKFNRLFHRAFHFRDFFLHAERVEFVHFVTEVTMKISAPLPKSFEKALETLGSKR